MLSRVSLLIGVCFAFGTAAHADFVISKKATHDVNCVSGVCSPTAPNANLNASELTNMLASGDVTLKSGNGDGTTPTIQIANAFKSVSPNRLTLEAKKDIVIKTPVSVAGTGALTLNYNQGNVGGDLLFGTGGKIDFRKSTGGLAINGNAYVLIGDLQALVDQIANNSHGFFALAVDYDASADGIYEHAVIRTTFQGSFEGLGHRISNLDIATHGPRKCIGLFAYNFLGTIRDITVDNVSIVDTGGNRHGPQLGAIAGCNGQTIVHAHATGSITGGSGTYVGGLVGQNSGTIVDSSADVAVSGTYSGGLVGMNDGPISAAHATGPAYARLGAGGLVGRFFGGLISQSYATGAVSIADHIYYDFPIAGGLAGGMWKKYGSGSIIDSYATGSVHGGSDCYAGGLEGENRHGKITASYSIGPVDGCGGVVGGFIGRNMGRDELTNDVWNVDTSGNSAACRRGKCESVTGLTDAQLKSGLPTGFDPNIWGSDPNINNGYPYLRANPPQ